MKRKIPWLVLAGASVVLLPLRICQLFWNQDLETGFYVDGALSTVITILLALAAAALVALNLRMREGRAYASVRSVPGALFSALGGVLLVLYSLTSAVPTIQTFQHQAAHYMEEGDQVHPLVYLLLAFASLFAGLAFLFAAFGLATGDPSLRRHPLVALLPSVWGCFCLVLLFILYTSVVNVSENIYDMVAMVFLLLFFFSQAKLQAGIEEVRASRRCFAFGMPAILLTLLTCVPNAVLLLGGRTQPSEYPLLLHGVNLALTAYALCFLLALDRQPALGAAAKSSAGEPENSGA